MARYLFLLVPVSLALSGCASVADHQMIGDREQVLLAQMRKACGGDAWDRVEGWHETGKVELPNGLEATYDAWSAMRDLATAARASAGEMQLRHVGFDGTEFWSVGQDGSVSIDRRDETLRKQRRDAYISSHAYFLPDRFPADFQVVGEKEHEGFSFVVLQVTPTGAGSVDLWIDPASFLVRRMVADQESVELSDYAFFHGVCTATTGLQRGKEAADTLTLKIETVSIEAQSSEIFIAPE
ncbi:hypothetical protein [Erythrobacter litoralis]|uniref:hypothetical protein n=1 Tax=Erythrobacter litoralis TaxID=39960 RepID=UPI0003227258|nr:hypothetical protein [Erythrobacter litoralis]